MYISHGMSVVYGIFCSCLISCSTAMQTRLVYRNIECYVIPFLLLLFFLFTSYRYSYLSFSAK